MYIIIHVHVGGTVAIDDLDRCCQIHDQCYTDFEQQYSVNSRTLR